MQLPANQAELETKSQSQREVEYYACQPLPELDGKENQPRLDDTINEIIPGLFVGDFYAATDWATLCRYRIQAVVNATWSGACPFGYKKGKIKYLRLRMKDDEKTILAPFIAKCNKFIHRQRTALKKNVLIHCSAGISRSVSLAIAYILLLDPHHALHYPFKFESYRDALLYVQSKRACARPNQSFARQLESMPRDK
jgi:atypical dual specificity phosphatase